MFRRRIFKEKNKKVRNKGTQAARKGTKDLGLTLMEVLLSLVITGIMVSVILTLYIKQYRLASQFMLKTELNYALLRAGQVLTSAVKAGEKVEWSGQVLRISYHQGDKRFVDTFYLADKDSNGIVDLYRVHQAVPNPVASGLTEFSCNEIQKGLWGINLRAGEGEKEISWERKVRQKICLD